MLLLFARVLYLNLQAPFLIPKLPKPSKPWKTTHLTTYQVRRELHAHQPSLSSHTLTPSPLLLSLLSLL